MKILPKQIGTKEGKILFEKAEKVKSFNEAERIVSLLKDSLDYYGGVGLAAPQIGISKRVFIVDIQPTKKYPNMEKIGFVPYINPEIKLSLKKNKDIEGCLSVIYGSLFGEVSRANSLKVKYFNLEGKEIFKEIKNSFHSRVVQHEFDHLEGKVFLQRMSFSDFPELVWDEEKDIRK